MKVVAFAPRPVARRDPDPPRPAAPVKREPRVVRSKIGEGESFDVSLVRVDAPAGKKLYLTVVRPGAKENERGKGRFVKAGDEHVEVSPRGAGAFEIRLLEVDGAKERVVWRDLAFVDGNDAKASKDDKKLKIDKGGDAKAKKAK